MVDRTAERKIVADFAKRMEMAEVKTCSQKRQVHRETYKSRGRKGWETGGLNLAWGYLGDISLSQGDRDIKSGRF